MPRSPITRRLVTLNPAAHQALARKWFLRGFAASGKGFNGEVFDREKHPAIESLLIAHFEQIYKQED